MKGEKGAMPIPEFKHLLKSYRLRARYGLRQFAELVGEIPSNYAAVESGRRAPWRVPERLRKVADLLGLEEGSRDWDAFFLSARQNGGMPPDLENLLEEPMIPVLLRTVRDKRLTEDELRRLIEEINSGRAPKRKKANGR
jgi:transcriptional regulator with XRE-family HTH domain